MKTYSWQGRNWKSVVTEKNVSLKRDKDRNLKSVVKNVYMQTYNQRLPDEASKKKYSELLGQRALCNSLDENSTAFVTVTRVHLAPFCSYLRWIFLVIWISDGLWALYLMIFELACEQPWVVKKLPVVKTILEAVEQYSPLQLQNWRQL